MSISKIYNTIIHGSKTLPLNVSRFLSHYKDATIEGITVARKPVNKIITNSLKLVSHVPYDQLFHLFLILSTSAGPMILEKNEVINLQMYHNQKTGSYFHIQDIPPNLTLERLINSTSLLMGDKFATYSAYDNNCQHFVKSVLNSVGIHSADSFIKQDTESIFKDNPHLRKFANTVTDVAARVSNVLQGGNISPNSHTNGTSGKQIEDILHHRRDFQGVFMKDELPEKLSYNCWYVVNMQSSTDGNGTHWVCLKAGNPFCYYDPFGITPPVEIMEKTHGCEILFSNTQIQDINSTACGWFCIACILSDTDYSPSNKKHFLRFINSFSKDTYVNDYILKNMLDRLL